MADDHDQAQRRAAVVSALASLAAFLAIIPQNILTSPPVPMRTSILSGQMWFDELMAGHPGRFHEQFGMSKVTIRSDFFPSQIFCCPSLRTRALNLRLDSSLSVIAIVLRVE